MSDTCINFDLNFKLESLDDAEPADRFQTLSNQEIEQIARERNEKATTYNTSWGVRTFKAWCKSKGKNPDFEKLSADDLNAFLRVFYAEVRNKQGERFAKQSFVGLRAAIHRHLTGEPFCRQMNILQDREFQAANNVFKGVLKQLKREGHDKSQHKVPISPGDLEKLKTINVSSPRGLQQLAWFYIEYYFGRRGREGLRALPKNCFVFCTDSDGNEYCKMAFNEATKNHPGD
ncbi:hypothetical protein HOLleu_38657 [Holothuria leucospilota]|uniref:Uncharacterized protein n=1 Tax=Holothuria leucospilota TaxID=206669 RepID=A0A9Q0YHC9_HOLLE|nr:hypothetical protein HOLleu_38657 [Holothuria leucospilota]